jgi:hypothetical protein
MRLFFLVLLLLFLIANRGAYEGYFQSDDLDNLSWTRVASARDFAYGIAAPRFFPGNFRPAGHFYYYVMGRWAGLNYPPYVAAIHLFHFVNIILLWLLMRRLGISAIAAACGAALFAFHMAAFDAYWRPMYVFDVLCCTFSLLCVLAYIKRHWIIGLGFLWLAYKAKELAVMLPAVLAVYEFTLGERKWKLLAPYFFIAAMFGLQGVLLNPNVDNDYTLRISWDAIQATVSFYAPKLVPFGWAGLVLLPVPFLFRDRRIWFGLAWSAFILFPMLLLPGRLSGAYLYIPLAGVAIAFSALLRRWHPAIPLLLIAVWLPWNYLELRNYRRAALTIAAENKAYVQGIADARAKAPEVRKFLYDGAPQEMHRWGVEGALRLIYDSPVELKSIEDKPQFESGHVVLLTWDPVARKLHTKTGSPERAEASYISMDPEHPVWQLKDGWYGREHQFRWIQPRATARLFRPHNARTFEVVLNAGPGQMHDVGRVRLVVQLDGKTIGSADYDSPSVHRFHWSLPPAAPGETKVEFLVEPEYRAAGDGRVLGAAIVSFGFRP